MKSTDSKLIRNSEPHKPPSILVSSAFYTNLKLLSFHFLLLRPKVIQYFGIRLHFLLVRDKTNVWNIVIVSLQEY